MSEEKISRFENECRLGVIVAIRGAESFDRYTVLKQGDYSTGRYGTQYDCAVCSPFMDLSTQDLWRTSALLDLDTNEIYDMYYEAGVPLAKQRIGSPVNSHSGDAVKLYKVLNPGTYSKMVGRLNNLDFTAAYGGVFNQGFKYITLDQPKPFYEGILTAPALIDAINYLELEYTRRVVSEKMDSEVNTRVHNAHQEPVQSGDNIRLVQIPNQFVRLSAAELAQQNSDQELYEYFMSNLPQEKTWYDYTKQLVNEAEPMYQKGWMPKIETSIRHWAKTGSAVDEPSLYGLMVLADRKDKSFGFDQLDYDRWVAWDLAGYTDVSRKPIIKLFRYLQDCPQNLAREYIRQMVERWNQGGKEEYQQNQTLRAIMEEGGVLPHLEVPALRLVEQPATNDIRFAVIQTDLDKIQHVRDSALNDQEMEILQNGTEEQVRDVLESKGKRFSKVQNWDQFVCAQLVEFGRKWFHDDVRGGGGSFKRTTIMCLRNDVKGTYMGFSQSTEERAIRANAEAAFASTVEERDKKLKELEVLQKQMEKEKKAQQVA